MFWDLWLALQFWIKLILYYMFLLGSEAIIFFGICMTDVTWGPRICWVDACIPGVVAETLTASGSYPYEFGHRVARLHTTFMESKPGYGVTSDLDALFKSGYQDCTLYQLTGCFCCEPLSVWICLWCGLGVNVLIYIYIHWDYIYILNIDIDIEPYLPIFLGLPCDLQTLGRTLAWHGSLRIWFLSRRCWLQQPRQESMNLTLCYLST